MKDLRQLSYFLGIEATRDSFDLHLQQTRYIIDLLDHVNLIGIRPYRAPCVLGTKLSKFDRDLLLDTSEYRHTVGALQYITLTCLDIAYSVNQLSTYAIPTTAHWTAAKRVLCYLKNNMDFGLFYKPGSFAINAYYDLDWAGDLDDRRSTCGYGVFVGPNLISSIYIFTLSLLL
ncbi:Retrovirus-related Pol polyprotein from transposon RE1 [Vitis vinifera]|uniref:Retrovirus-related Pol polyprotein from transposon RE1 n=1 Tax=Vitis vinifera TaxID=29760 RepID=A0A438D7Q1_VITVI|nr:Retrovirus-related Pol polyprotein from transposon RE1 [Vitis vinifera]